MLIQPSEESVVMNILNKPLSPVELIKVSQTHTHMLGMGDYENTSQ